MDFKLKTETKELIKAFSISGILIVTFFVLITNLKAIEKGVTSVIGVLTPFLLGMAFSFILMPLRNIFENKVLKNVNIKPALKRRLSVTFAMAIMVMVIVIFFSILIPQLVSSVTSFASNIDGYLQNAQNSLQILFHGDAAFVEDLSSSIEKIVTSFSTWIGSLPDVLNAVVSTIGSFVSGIMNFFIGMIITIYILTSSEKFKRQVKKFLYAFVPKKYSDYIVKISQLTAEMFYRFIYGQGMDSILIGIICYIGCSLLKIPYTVMIGFIVGLTNMIPVFGPFIGAVPCIIILVLVNWFKAAEFAIFILVLQQIDGNIIAPHILGDAVGLPGLWVMFAIIVGGSLFGVVGMFAGVPAFAVIFTLLREVTNRRLKERKIDIE